MGYNSNTPISLITISSNPLYNGIILYYYPEDNAYYDDTYDFSIVNTGSSFYFRFQDENKASLSGDKPIPRNTNFTIIDATLIDFSVVICKPDLIISGCKDEDLNGIYNISLNSSGVFGAYAKWVKNDNATCTIVPNGGAGYQFYELKKDTERISQTVTGSLTETNFIPVSGELTEWTNGVIAIPNVALGKYKRYFENKQQKQGTSPYIAVKTVTE